MPFDRYDRWSVCVSVHATDWLAELAIVLGGAGISGAGGHSERPVHPVGMMRRRGIGNTIG